MSKQRLNIIISSHLLLLFSISEAQITLNEICQKNATVIMDEDGDSEDWIEIYNGGPDTVNLINHFLSDDLNDRFKWTFPNIVLYPDSFVIIFASGKYKVQTFAHTNFKLSSQGEVVLLSDPNGVLIDQQVIGEIQADHSYGRFPDGSNNFYYFEIPTPATTNMTKAYHGYADIPLFYPPAGFYSEDVPLVFTSEDTVRFTFNGKPPDNQDSIYQTTLVIDSTLVISARAFKDSMLPSVAVVNTYFIREETRLPVISIATDPYNLWDWDNGIYVEGPGADSIWPHYGANYWKDTEIPVHFEYYDEHKFFHFGQNLGMGMHGARVARTQPMKALKLTARSKYGKSTIDYPLFPSKQNLDLSRFILRNSGSDFNETHFRDALLHTAMINDNLDIDMVAYQPAHVYLNGQYWGIHNIREKTDRHYVESNYGINPDDIDLIEEDTVVITGSSIAFENLVQFAATNNLSIQNNFDSILKMIDIESMTDYYIAETYWNNTDWPHANIKCWKEQKSTSKWRYLLFDLDASLNAFGFIKPSTDNLGVILFSQEDYIMNSKSVDVFRNILLNKEYEKYFITRYADLMNTTFSTANMQDELLNVKEALELDIDKHFDRWPGNTVSWWNYWHIGLATDFINDRPLYARQYVQDGFALPFQFQLTIQVVPETDVSLRLNTIKTDNHPWQGTYFGNVPVTIGTDTSYKKFDHWYIHSSKETIYDSIFSYQYLQDDTVTLFLMDELNTGELFIFPNPATANSKALINCETPKPATILVHDSYGRIVRNKTISMLTAGYNQIDLPINALNSGVYQVSIQTEKSLASGKIIIN